EQKEKYYNEKKKVEKFINYEFKKLINEANELYEKKDYEAAAEKYKGALILVDNSEEIYYNLAVIYYKTNRPELAIENINKAIEINPKNFENKKFKFMILFKTNNFNEIKKFKNSLNEEDKKEINNLIEKYLTEEL
ncbi:MAG TPA: tetratricopeptide repeat protein, partial [bacterium]|nr:tetratricopeptide repeat protein [bacterium]